MASSFFHQPMPSSTFQRLCYDFTLSTGCGLSNNETVPPCGRTPFGTARKSGRGASYQEADDPVIPLLPGRIQCRAAAPSRQQHRGTEMVMPCEPKCGTLWPHSRFLSGKIEWLSWAIHSLGLDFLEFSESCWGSLTLRTHHPMLAKLQAFIGSPEAAWQPSSTDSRPRASFLGK